MLFYVWFSVYKHKCSHPDIRENIKQLQIVVQFHLPFGKCPNKHVFLTSGLPLPRLAMEGGRVSLRALRITRRHSDARERRTSGKSYIWLLKFHITSCLQGRADREWTTATKKGVANLLLVVFEEKLQVSTSWLQRNLCDLGGRIGITHQLIKFHRIRMRVVKVKGTHWTLELFQNR